MRRSTYTWSPATIASIKPTAITVSQDDIVWAQLGGCAATGAANNCVPIPGATSYALDLRANGAPVIAQAFDAPRCRCRAAGCRDVARYDGACRALGFGTDRVTSGRATTISVWNPSSRPAEVGISRVHDGRVDQLARRVTVPPGGRAEVMVVRGQRKAEPNALIVDASSPVIVERTIVGGTDISTSPGTPIG